MRGAAIFTRMTKVEDIQKAVEQLSPEELAEHEASVIASAPQDLPRMHS